MGNPEANGWIVIGAAALFVAALIVVALFVVVVGAAVEVGVASPYRATLKFLPRLVNDDAAEVACKGGGD